MRYLRWGARGASRARARITRCSTAGSLNCQRAARDRPGDRRGVAISVRIPGQEAVLEDGLDHQRNTFARRDGEFEARSRSAAASPRGARSGRRLLADRAVELGYMDSVSHETVAARATPSNRGGAVGWIPPQRNADFVAGMERVLDGVRTMTSRWCASSPAPAEIETRSRRHPVGRPAKTTRTGASAPATCTWPPNRCRPAPDQGDRAHGPASCATSPRSTPTPPKSRW